MDRHSHISAGPCRCAAVAAAVAIVCCFPNTAPAATTYGDIVVSAEPGLQIQTYHGYVEYAISVTNKSDKTDHRVTLTAPAKAYGYGDHIRRITRTFVVNRGSSVTISMPQPPMPMGGRDMKVVIDWIQRDDLPLPLANHCDLGWHGSSRPPCVLLSWATTFDDFEKGIEAAYAPPAGSSHSSTAVSSMLYGGSGGPKKCTFARAEAAVSSWRTNWLAYSCYDGIVLTTRDMQEMPSGVQSAIAQYVQCGGSLLVIGEWQPPDSWACTSARRGIFELYYTGFGVCAVTTREDTSSWDSQTWKDINEKAWRESSGFSLSRSLSEANSWFPVVANLGVPVRGLFALVLLFAIIMGPVNLAVLSQKKRRIWLLWTVPLISIVAGLSVFLYSFVREGWRGHLRSECITILNEGTRQATSIAVSALYCPLTPRGGLHFDYETEVSPTGHEGFGYGRPRTVDWTSHQHLASGWAAARIPAHFLLRKSQTRRERMQFSEESGVVLALNGLGADVQQLWYADSKGKTYTAQNVAAGARMELVASEISPGPASPADSWRQAFTSGWPESGLLIAGNPGEYMRANSYIAIINDTPFIEEFIGRLKSRSLKTVVFGLLSEPADAGTSK